MLLVMVLLVCGVPSLASCGVSNQTDSNMPAHESQTSVVRTKNGALDWSINTPTKTCTVKDGTTTRKVRC
jgi:hypothetical protein